MNELQLHGACSQSAPDDKGLLICVVGPSGSGKDTLLRGLRTRFADRPEIHFVTRVITRPADDDHEYHESIGKDEFRKRLARGELAVYWQAHGLFYAIPISTLALVERGSVAIVNGSRAALPSIIQVFPRNCIVNVQVEPAILQQRLEQRGRESLTDINQRVARSIPPTAILDQAWTLDNSGSAELAIDKLQAFVEKQLQSGGE